MTDDEKSKEVEPNDWTNIFFYLKIAHAAFIGWLIITLIGVAFGEFIVGTSNTFGAFRFFGSSFGIIGALFGVLHAVNHKLFMNIWQRILSGIAGAVNCLFFIFIISIIVKEIIGNYLPYIKIIGTITFFGFLYGIITNFSFQEQNIFRIIKKIWRKH